MNIAIAEPWIDGESWRTGLRANKLLPAASPANNAILPLLEALGWRGDLRGLAELLELHPRTLDWGDAANLMRALGYISHTAPQRLSEIRSEQLPCLFYSKRHAYLLISRSDHAILARDLTEDHALSLEPSGMLGTIMTFKPDEPAIGERSDRWFRSMLRKFRGQFQDILLLGLFISLFVLAVPLFTMLVYDRVIAGRDGGALIHLALGACIALMAEGALRVLRASMLAWFGVRANHLIGITFFQRLLALEPLSIERAPPGAQVVRAKAMESIRDFFTGQSFIIFIEFPFLPVLLGAILLLAPPMALACFLTALVLMGLIAVQMRGVRESARHSARRMAERQRNALEIFGKLETLRLTGTSDALFSQFVESNRRALHASGEMSWRLQIAEHGVLATSMLGGLATLIVGVEQVWAGALTPGGLIGGMIIAWRLLMPLQQLAAMTPRLEQVNGAIFQLEQLLSLPPERPQASDTFAAQPLRGKVELVNVAMRYPRQSDPVFSGLNLTIEPGQLITIAGANGSGKSSVLKLIGGMYPQAAGAIRLDGLDIRQLDPLGLRRGISYIPQTIMLFSGTVRENILLSAPLATDAQLEGALHRAHAYRDVLALPQGLDTQVGTGGMQVPQVLAFKIALARAYVDLKPLILCDELPYALLNTAAGEQFRQQLLALKGSHTIILVAHTTDLVRVADKAVFLRAAHRPVVGDPADILPLMLEEHYVHLG